MGGGPDREEMLICLWEEYPKDLIEGIKSKFPYIDVTYYQMKTTSAYKAPENKGGVPADLWKKATILVTLAVLPPRPEDAPNLKLIHFFSAGVDAFLKHPIFTDSDIAITTSSGIHGPPISEWILMTSLIHSKHYNTTYENQKRHEWGKNDLHMRDVSDWVGKRIGVAGYGGIGRHVGRVFQAMGSTVLAYTATPRTTAESRKDTRYIVPGTGDPDGIYPSAWYSGTSKADLHSFLAQDLDMIIMCLPLTPGTTHLLGAAEFDVLSRKKAFVVNISRGKIFDQRALVDALNEGKLRGAALDVTDPEPLPKDDPLWDAKNVIISPHVSALGREYAGRAYEVLFTNLKRRERGERMFNLVDRKKGY